MRLCKINRVYRFVVLFMVVIYLDSYTKNISLGDTSVSNVSYIHQVLDMDSLQFHGHNACGPTSALMIVNHNHLLPERNSTLNGYYVYNRYDSIPDKSDNFYDRDSSMDWIQSTNINENKVAGAHGYITEYVAQFDNWVTIHSNLVDYLENHGFICYEKSSNILDVIKKNIRNGNPLIGHTTIDGNGHFLVITGFDGNNNLIVHDPYGNANSGGTWNGTTVGESIKYSTATFAFDKVFEVFPVGVLDSTFGFYGWHNDTSEHFVRAYNLHSDSIGMPFDNGGSKFVHEYWYYDILIQDFREDTTKPHYGTDGESALMYSGVKDSVFLVKEGFWGYYKKHDGFDNIGEPFTEEYKDGDSTKQKFFWETLKWDGDTVTGTSRFISLTINAYDSRKQQVEAEIWHHGDFLGKTPYKDNFCNEYTYHMVAKISDENAIEFDFTVNESDSTVDVYINKTPELTSPQNNSIQSSDIVFQWKAVQNAQEYILFVKMPGDTNYVSDQVAANSYSFTPNKLGIHLWKVKAVINGIPSNSSADWTFDFIGFPGVELKIPENNSKTNELQPVFSWHVSAQATTYEIQIFEDGRLDKPVRNEWNIRDTLWKLDRVELKNGHMYSWRIRPRLPIGHWSGFFNVYVDSGATNNKIIPVINNSNIKVLSIVNNIIKYTLQKKCFVSIKYYDIRGRTVYSYMHRVQSPGRYTFKMPLSSLSQGIYLQEFKAGDFCNRKVFTVIR